MGVQIIRAGGGLSVRADTATQVMTRPPRRLPGRLWPQELRDPMLN